MKSRLVASVVVGPNSSNGAVDAVLRPKISGSRPETTSASLFPHISQDFAIPMPTHYHVVHQVHQARAPKLERLRNAQMEAVRGEGTQKAPSCPFGSKSSRCSSSCSWRNAQWKVLKVFIRATSLVLDIPSPSSSDCGIRRVTTRRRFAAIFVRSFLISETRTARHRRHFKSCSCV